MSETIQLSSIGVTGIKGLDETSLLSFQISLNLTGGSFTMSILRNSNLQLPIENSVLTLPYGRFGIVKNVGQGWSRGGIVDTVSGPALPLPATQIGFTSINPKILYPGIKFKGIRDAISLATHLAQGINVIWTAFNPLLRNFIYRGEIIGGISQLAGLALAEVCINRNNIYVSPPGTVVTKPAQNFVVPTADIVNVTQNVDYSLDYPSILDPSLLSANFLGKGTFIFDDQHAQKQGPTTVQTGAPGGSGSADFIPIPDGWMVDGTFEEWTPVNPPDLTNPNSSAVNGRYWKVYPSPITPGALRGILTFDRMVKPLNLPGNVSPFVGSPVTAQSQGTNLQSTNFVLDAPGTENGIFGFTANDIEFSDIISGQYVKAKTAIVLLPPNGVAGSGPAADNFYTLQIGLWTFPTVSPTVFPGTAADPTNPFGIPPGVLVARPSQAVINLDVQAIEIYYAQYLLQFRRINSPRLKTNLTCVFRNYMPQPGDALMIPNGVNFVNCGRISAVTLNYSRGGVTLNIQAEFFQFYPGRSQQILSLEAA